MRRLLFLVLIFISLFLSACGASTNQAAQTVTISLESYNYGTPSLGGKGTQKLINEFQAAYPHIKIAARNVPAADGLKTVVAEAAAGNPPDIAQLGLNNLNYIVNNLPVQAIDQIAPKNEYEDTVKHIVPQALKLGEANGHLYGSPYTISLPTLYYNADIFRAAGLDPNKPPTTWEEAHADSQQIKQKTGKAALVIYPLPDPFDWVVQSLINSNGGTTISPDGKHATFNQPQAIAVYQMWRTFVAEGLQPHLNSKDALAAMSSGNLGMLMTTSAYLPSISAAASGKFDLRTAAEPAFGTQAVRPVNSGSALFTFTKDPVKQHAVWEFMHFVSSQRGYTIITSVMGYLPLRDDVLNDPRYLKPFIQKDSRLSPIVNQLGSLNGWVSWPGEHAAQIVTLFMQAVYDVVYNGQDAQKTMDTAATRIDTLIS